MLMKQEGGKIKRLSSSLLSELFTPTFSTSSQNEHTNSCSLPSIILPRPRVRADGSSDSAFCMWKRHADCGKGYTKQTVFLQFITRFPGNYNNSKRVCALDLHYLFDRFMLLCFLTLDICFFSSHITQIQQLPSARVPFRLDECVAFS